MSEREYLSIFKPFHKVAVKYKSIDHIIKYQEYNAIYPYAHISRSVFLEPKDKTTKYYQDTYDQLGDHWSVDISSIPVEDYTNILNQLGILEDVLYG
jgi:hypothetical protein